MPTIRLTDRTLAARSRPATRALMQAAVTAQRAPSIFNTQPWRWNIHDETAELRADRDRQLPVVDAEGRMLTLSCGVALHHARVALAGTGHVPAVSRLPDPQDPDLLAIVGIATFASASPTVVRLHQAIAHRHTDRRPFADQPVPADGLGRLRDAAEQQGAHLHLLPPDNVVLLTVAASRAADAELADPGYRGELAAWTHQTAETGEGVPLDTTGPVGRRRVPVRDFAPEASNRPVIADIAERQARYAVLFTDGDDPASWLTAGEALSAVLLTATTNRLATSPMSDVIEVPSARRVLYDLIGRTGHPMVALRIGIPADSPQPAPGAPRHSGAALITAADAEA
ncbi:MAG: nitroreductase [Dactylosporangium sp.]|jgi:nitroreductase|nr:nitroreductase [Dactylosporangium sp.]